MAVLLSFKSLGFAVCFVAGLPKTVAMLRSIVKGLFTSKYVS